MTDKELKELAKHNNYPEEHLPMLVDFGRAVLMARRQFDLEEMTRAVRAERNKVAQWIIKRSYATGHGDSVEDLLKELEWQVKEACAKIAETAEPYQSADLIRKRGQA